jgi:hypothetical protein
MYVPFKASKRADPTMTLYSRYTGTAGQIRDEQNAADVAGTVMGVTSQSGFAWRATASASNTTTNLQAQWCADARF